MESKSIKVIDEHGIDRDANIICGFDVDGSDYVFYWIERDADNDNLFVSKVVKNNDGTSNMINIEDGMEKSKISEIIKEMVTHAVNTGDAKIDGNNLALASGKKLGIINVIFNKEQNINVQKTYVTTVKKAVTKVSKDFYVVPVVTVPEAIEAPSVEPVQDIVFPEMETSTVVPESAVETSATPEAVVVPEVQVAPVTPVVPVAPVPEVAATPEVKVEIPTIEAKPVVNEPVAAPIPTVNPAEGTTVLPNAINQKMNIVSGEESAAAVVAPTPVNVPGPVPSPASTMVFDASKETNLNVAMGEVSSDSAIPVSDVQPIREFGQDDAAVAPEEVIATSGKKMGFANNKFFMVVAIMFFLASCVFLGYEVYQYFTLK